MWTAASIPRHWARPKPDPDIPQQIKKTPLDERRYCLERFAWL